MFRPDLAMAKLLDIIRLTVAAEEGLVGKPLSNQRLLEVLLAEALDARGVVSR